jgi:hypothetical protein
MLIKITKMALVGALIVGTASVALAGDNPNSANGGKAYDRALSTKLMPRAWRNGSKAYDFVPAAIPCPKLEGYPDCHQ